MPNHRPLVRRARSRAVPRLVATLILALAVAACGGPAPSSSPAASPGTASPTPVGSPAASSSGLAVASPSASASAAPSGSPTGSPSASVDAQTSAAYDLIERQVASLRGLPATKAVPRRFIDSAELRSLITADFDKHTPPDYLDANDRLYKALGLIPADSDLRKLTLDLLSGGVVGFYRNEEGAIYVLSKAGEPGVVEQFYFAHEFDHALQDQHFSVFRDQEGILDQGDRILARQAVYEGDASLLMTQWAAANLSQPEMLELVKGSSDPEAQALIEGMPAILRETLVYPYTTGLAWAQRAHGNGGWKAVDDIYARLPESTEQILHPEKYAAGETPVAVTVPADLATQLGTGWTSTLTDTFGEFQTGIWLREGGVANAAATDAAAGWGGDRLTVLEGPDGSWALAWKTAWDTDADAEAFETAATTAVGKAGGAGRVLPGEGGKIRWVVVANDASTLGRVAGVLGLAG